VECRVECRVDGGWSVGWSVEWREGEDDGWRAAPPGRAVAVAVAGEAPLSTQPSQPADTMYGGVHKALRKAKRWAK
jgi:hypothetical protein